MPQARNRFQEDYQTPLGAVRIIDWCSPAFVVGRQMDEGLGSFPSYRSIFFTPEGLSRVADGRSADVILGLNEGGRIVGYCALSEPFGKDFWGRLGPGALYEIVALEVSRRYRGCRLGQRLLHIGLTNEIFEDRIVYMVGYSWTWDLEGAGLTATEYRRLLMDMLLPYGFKRYPTNEPNVSLRPENIFMARIGSRVPEETIRKFKRLLFGLV